MSQANIIKPQQLRSRATQERILKAAQKLIEIKDFDSISMAEIAAVANVSVGNIYNRFGDKTDLLIALHDFYETERTEYLRDELSSEKWSKLKLRPAIKKITTLYVDFFLSRRGLIRSFVMYHRNHPDTMPTTGRNTLVSLSRSTSQVITNSAKNDKIKVSEKTISTSMQMLLALCREMILFGNEPSKKVLKLSREQLIEDLSVTVYAYITCSRN